MQAVLLAAGQSSRFVPFNEIYTHKSLISFMGKTLLEHTLESLKNAGVTDVILVVKNKEPFEQALPAPEVLGMSISYVILPEALGMGAAILQAKELLQERFFVMNANHIEVGNFAKDMIDAQKDDETVVLVGKEDTNFDIYGFFQYESSIVTRVIEKPKEVLHQALRIIGIYLLNKTFINTLEQIPPGHYNFETALDVYAKTQKITFIKTSHETITLKYAWDLFAIKNYLLTSIKKFTASSATVADSATIIGNVYIDEGAKISENVCIKGPCYIGKNVFVGNNSLLRNGVIVEKDAVIGSYIEVKNSIIMDDSTTHTGLLEDSIVGRYCRIAADILTANVRLDRKEIWSIIKNEKVNTGLTAFGMILGEKSDVGVRVTTMPGIIVGNNVLIGPSTTVIKNIASNTKFYTKFSEIVEVNEK